jgi:hypothetical protein
MRLVDYFTLAVVSYGSTTAASPLGAPPRRPPPGLSPAQHQNWNSHCSRNPGCNWEQLKKSNHVIPYVSFSSFIRFFNKYFSFLWVVLYADGFFFTLG